MRRSSLVEIGALLRLVVVCLVVSASAFAQTGNGQLSGSVVDSSKALLPGVTITLTNTETGVSQSQLSNENGLYNFPSVPFGTKYRVSAALPGFKTANYTNVEVGLNATVRVNITMEVGDIASTIDVTARA